MLRPRVIGAVSIVMGVLFVLIGLLKLAGPSGTHWAVRLSQWGYPAGARYGIGGIEILGGVGLLVPTFRRPAAVTIGVVMLGAFVTHLVHGEFVRLLTPLLFGGVAYGLYSGQSRLAALPSRHKKGE